MKVVFIALIVLFVGTSAVSAETMCTTQTKFIATVTTQARINVDAQGEILSIHNVTDGTVRQPQTLHIYCEDINAPMTPAILSNLEKITEKIDWSKGGIVYRRQIEVCLCDDILKQRA